MFSWLQVANVIIKFTSYNKQSLDDIFVISRFIKVEVLSVISLAEGEMYIIK